MRHIVRDDRITIVALTAYSTEMFTEKCFNAGMDVFMIKPVQNDQLKELLTENQLI